MDENISQIRFTGTQINYYFVCIKKVWYFVHDIQMEQNSDAVYLGKLIHETSYEREKKEIDCAYKELKPCSVPLLWHHLRFHCAIKNISSRLPHSNSG